MRIARLAVLLLLGMAGSAANAGGFEGEVGYLHLDGDGDITLGSVYGIVGYTWEGTGAYSGTVEFMGAYGVKDDTINAGGFSVDAELDSILGVGYRGTMEINPDVSWYYRVAYARVDISASAFGVTLSADDSDFGAGIGLNYRRFTIGYMTFFGDLDGGDALMIGYRF